MARKKRIYRLLAVLAILVLAAFIFRNEGLFMYQRWRLQAMDCGTGNRLSKGVAIDKLSGCQKLWAHRVNSIERLEKLQHYFGGLETDVMFDAAGKQFQIYHPPAPPSGLLLEDFFSRIKAGGTKLWLDVKGLPPSGPGEAVNELLRLDRQYRVKENIIVESSDIPFINALAAAGFTVSFIVPLDYLTKAIPVDSIRVQLSPQVAFVSQEDIYIDRLKKKFPGKKMITWATTFSNYTNLSHFRQLVADSMISVILVNVKSSGYK